MAVECGNDHCDGGHSGVNTTVVPIDVAGFGGSGCPFELFESFVEEELIGLVDGGPREDDLMVVHALESVFEHRSVGFAEDILPDFDYVVGGDAEKVTASSFPTSLCWGDICHAFHLQRVLVGSP